MFKFTTTRSKTKGCCRIQFGTLYIMHWMADYSRGKLVFKRRDVLVPHWFCKISPSTANILTSTKYKYFVSCTPNPLDWTMYYLSVAMWWVEKINVTGKAIPKNESNGTIRKLVLTKICLLEFILRFSVNAFYSFV